MNIDFIQSFKSDAQLLTYLSSHKSEIPLFLEVVGNREPYNGSLIENVFTLLSDEEVEKISEFVNQFFVKTRTDINSCISDNKPFQLKILLKHSNLPKQEILSRILYYQTMRYKIIDENRVEVMKIILECFPIKYFYDVYDNNRLGWSPLYFAAFGGDIEAIENMNGSGFIPPAVDTHLHLAARNGDLKVVEKVYQMYPSEKAFSRDFDYRNPLHWAVERGSPETIRFLASHCPPEIHLFSGDKINASPLHIAASKSRADLIPVIIELCPEEQKPYLFASDRNYDTPFINAVWDSSGNTMKALLLSTPEPFLKLQCTSIILEKAAMSGHVNVIKILLSHTPNQLRSNLFSNDSRALEIAAYQGHAEVIKELLSSCTKEELEKLYARQNSLVKAVEGGKTEIIKLLFQLTPPELVDSLFKHYTLIIEALHFRVAQTLIECCPESRLHRLFNSHLFDTSCHFLSVIQNFGLSDPEKVFKIAKVSLMHNPYDVSQRIQNYKFTDILYYRRLALAAIAFILPKLHSKSAPEAEEILSRLIKPYPISMFEPLLSFKQKISRLENPTFVSNARKILIAFVYSTRIHHDQEKLKAIFQKYPDLISSIFEGRDSTVYWPILDALLHISFDELIDTGTTNNEKLMGILPFLSLQLGDKALMHKILKSELRDLQLRNTFIKLIETIKTDEDITKENTIKMLNWVFRDVKKRQQIINSCNTVQALYNLKSTSVIHKALSESVSLDKVLVENFNKILPAFKSNENVHELLLKTFLSMRFPTAIFIYAAGIKRLGSTEHLDSLTLFVSSVFDGTFKQVRQDISRNAHLEKLHQSNSSVLERYHQSSSLKLALNNTTSTPIHIKIHAILKNAILNDGHLKDEMLKIDISEISPEFRNFTPIKNVLRGWPYSSRWHSSFNSDHLYFKLQKHLVELHDKDVTEEKFNECFQLFKEAFHENAEILNDLKAIQQLFKESDNESNTATITDTDDPYEILVCGTEVLGSCQRVDGDPYLNCGLLGFLLNGQTRLITLKTASSKTIKGRAIIRLLLNSKNEPVLFLERIYPQGLEQNLKTSLINFAKRKADLLGIPLISKEHGKDKSMEKVFNHGVLATEYVDAVFHLDKKYTTTGSYVC